MGGTLRCLDDYEDVFSYDMTVPAARKSCFLSSFFEVFTADREP